MKVLLGLAGALLLVLAGLFAASRWCIHDAERRFPPTGGFVTVDGLRQHYVEKGGSERTIVLVHGANGAVQDFTATILDTLAARHRVIAVDRPGHGYSERPAAEPVTPDVQARLLHGVLRQLHVERPILVGFSFGGAVVLSYALQYQDELGALVLLAGAAHVWPTPVDLKWRMPEWPLLGPLLTELVVPELGRLVAEDGVREAFAPDPVSASYAGAPLPLALRPASFRANAMDVNHVKPFLAEQGRHYGELRLPVQLLTGDADRVVSPTLHSAALAREAPDAEIVFVPGAGHLLPYAHPDAVLQAIERAVERARAAGR